MMGSFYEINQHIRGIAMTLYVIGFAGILYSFIGAVSYKVHRKIVIKYAICLAIESIMLYILFVGFHCMKHNVDIQVPATYIEKIPSIIIIIISFVNVLLSVVYLFNLKKWVDTHVSFISLKEGIDALPIGICFYTIDGLSLLINSKMEELCYKITGHALFNGINFWEEIVDNAKSYWLENKLMIKFDDNECWCFERQPIYDNLWQIVCINVTEENKLNSILEEENERINDVNKRLCDMRTKVANIAIQEEKLAAKANIHSDMGHALLSSKALLLGEDKNVNVDEITCTWRAVLELLRCGNKVSVSNNTVNELYKAADFLGLNLIIDGDIPSETELIGLFIACSRECMTNVARHAKEKELQIIIEESERQVKWRFINKLQHTIDSVIEGGGLTSLRKMITKLNGKMSIDTNEMFQLTVTLDTRKEENNEVPCIDSRR